MSNYSMSLSMSNGFVEAINVARQVICEARSIKPEEESHWALSRGYYTLGFAFLPALPRARAAAHGFDVNPPEDLVEAAKAFRFGVHGTLNEQNSDPNATVDNFFYALAIGNLAVICAYEKNFEEALVFYQKRLEIACSAGDVRAQLRTHVNMGDAYIQTAQSQEACEHFLKALALLDAQTLEKPGMKPLKARLLFNVAGLYGMLGNFKEGLLPQVLPGVLRVRPDRQKETSAMARAQVLIDECVEKLQKVPGELLDLYLDYQQATRSPSPADEQGETASVCSCSSSVRGPPPRPPPWKKEEPKNEEDMMDMLERLQGRRMNSQRTELPIVTEATDDTPEPIRRLLRCPRPRARASAAAWPRDSPARPRPSAPPSASAAPESSASLNSDLSSLQSPFL
ncbi:hypothetical protein M3Y99_00616500 [Aphelenchoides fujianensis]|nr:hypothetical protein M3Y99_00616500 [Aphelenchoides fujianensis]